MKNFSLFLVKNRYPVLAAWLVVLIISVINSVTSPNTFETGIGEIKNSVSKTVNEKLKSSFSETVSNNLIITFSSKKFQSSAKIYRENLLSLEKKLREKAEIRTTFSSVSSPLPDLSGKSGTAVILIQLVNPDFAFAESFVPVLRSAVKSFLSENNSRDSSLKIFVTGNAAFSYDMNIISEKEGQDAEKKVLLLTFLVLIFAFRSLSASLIAVLAGFSASIITISLLKVLTGYFNLSIFCQNVSTMLGLGFGIDYSLLLINRYRQELGGSEPGHAIQRTLATAGISVFYSGLTVLTGFLALLLPGLKLTDSIAIGGTLVVLLSVITALTVTPLLLYICTNALEFPRFLQRFRLLDPAFNRRWAEFITRNSMSATIISLTVLLFLSFPVFQMKLADPDIAVMPGSMEARQGFQELQNVAPGDLMFPLYILVTAKQGLITDTANIVQLSSLLEKLKKEERISNIYSILSLYPGLGLTDYLLIYNSGIFSKEFQFMEKLLISKDKKTTLLQVFPRKKLDSFTINRLVKTLREIPAENLQIEVGGPASVSHDLIERLYSGFPLIIAFVYLVTVILLAYAFRSLVIPLKAIFVNTLSLTASFGLMVLVFQYGWFAGLIGLEQVTGSLLSGVPVILFCIMFCLSMDYEVFLLSRIHEEYQKTGDNEQAIITGLEGTGEVITRAALIMLIVFGAFTLADIILIKMLGTGLVIAVFIDATIIRMILVPAFMKLAGRANWYFPNGK